MATLVTRHSLVVALAPTAPLLVEVGVHTLAQQLAHPAWVNPLLPSSLPHVVTNSLQPSSSHKVPPPPLVAGKHLAPLLSKVTITNNNHDNGDAKFTPWLLLFNHTAQGVVVYLL